MYKRYERYKDSGVEWIGEIPEHWEVKRLKDFSSIIRGTVDKSSKEDEVPVYLIQYTNVYYKREQKKNDIDYLPITVTENEWRNSKVHKGDILLTASSETPDDIGRSSVIVDELANHVFGSDVLRIRISEATMILNYKKYLIENYVYLHIINSLCRGVTRFRFGMNDFKTIRYLIPPIIEQKAIANLLDQKTSEIDSLIADKEELMKKLEEYKQSIITEAVTKGLNPDVKMKDSGIEWIKEVPEHWEVTKVKYIACINTKVLPENTPENYEIEYLDISNVDSNGTIINIEPMLFKNSPSRARRVVSKGDTIVSTVRTYLRAITWFEVVDSNLICSTGFAVLSPKSAIEPRYLSYLIRSTPYVEEIVRRSVGVSYPAITSNEIGRLNCLLPTLQEQKSIIKYIDNQLSKTEGVISDVKLQIQNLKSYRQSLIYEAVTGKIDVRDYQPERGEQLA